MNSGPGIGLGGAVAGEERLLGDPPRHDHGLVEERQDDVAAAEDERTRAVEAVEQAAGCATRRRAASGRADETGRTKSCAHTIAVRRPIGNASVSGSAGTPAAKQRARRRPRRRGSSRAARTCPGRAAPPRSPRPRSAALTGAACQRSCHRDHGRQDDRGGGELEPVHPARAGEVDVRAPRARAR